MTSLAQADTEGARLAQEAWATIRADVTVADALEMPYGPHRNLTLRKAVGFRLDDRATCMIGRATLDFHNHKITEGQPDDDTIHVTVDSRLKAQRVAAALTDASPSLTVTVTRRPGAGWAVTGHTATAPTPPDPAA